MARVSTGKVVVVNRSRSSINYRCSRTLQPDVAACSDYRILFSVKGDHLDQTNVARRPRSFSGSVMPTDLPAIAGVDPPTQRLLVSVLDKLTAPGVDREVARRATYLKWRLEGYDPLLLPLFPNERFPA